MGLLYDRMQIWVHDDTGAVNFHIIFGTCVPWCHDDKYEPVDRLIPIPPEEFNLAFLGALGII